ncbi:hypothetical protein [Methylomonas koyamae]|uniref:Uncharacterized protein n=1 Tax=Methylomonas koyamae TaxID=702114 RepID=A0A291IFI9_9GAMM|nr:hypothetical protein [Methylomonas koyamae]ATG89113.1 hypothetical protein MKLM6_0841 [Methylomonas koyamae]OAI29466.1 hypothetical protein A1356_23095 [Methylomonas koyamae]
MADLDVTSDDGNPSESGGDVQAQIQQAINQHQSDWATQFEQETGHKDVKSLMAAHQQELTQSKERENAYKTKFEKLQIDAAILAETGDAISPAIVKDLLAGKASCDENGTVTIDGKPVGDAIKDLLENNPFLAKAQGGTGSGAPAVSTAATQKMGRDDFNRMTPAQRQKFIKDGGEIV